MTTRVPKPSQTHRYDEKDTEYFGSARTEILSAVPERCERMLEIGCGTGATLMYIASQRTGVRFTSGIELMPEPAAVAKANLTEALSGDVEAMTLPEHWKDFDVILCLDVLEHLRDPWALVRDLTRRLRPGGAIVCSIPNVRHVRVVLPLLLFGRWRYESFGLLDATHLRFFTKATAVDLLETGGARVDFVKGLGRWDGKSAIANALTFGLFRHLFDFQYLIRAIKPLNA